MIENEKDNNKNNDNNEKEKSNSINASSIVKRKSLPKIKQFNIKPQLFKLLKEIETKKENNNIFLTENNEGKKGGMKVKRYNNLIKSYTDRGGKRSIEDFNVFGNEDKFIKELMDKFNEKSIKKLGKMEKKKLTLDKLYGISPEFRKRITIARKNKDLPLEEYQANTFKIFTGNDIGKSELYDLAYNLKHLRLQSDSVAPLPPIKLNIICDHVFKKNKNKSKKNKKITLKQFLNESHAPKDEFEKEEKLIKQMMSYRIIQRGKRNKAYDILPEYLKTALSKRFKKDI